MPNTWTTTNSVAFNGVIRKDEYDDVFDNTQFLHQEVLQCITTGNKNIIGGNGTAALFDKLRVAEDEAGIIDIAVSDQTLTLAGGQTLTGTGASANIILHGDTATGNYSGTFTARDDSANAWLFRLADGTSNIAEIRTDDNVFELRGLDTGGYSALTNGTDSNRPNVKVYGKTASAANYGAQINSWYHVTNAPNGSVQDFTYYDEGGAVVRNLLKLDGQGQFFRFYDGTLTNRYLDFDFPTHKLQYTQGGSAVWALDYTPSTSLLLAALGANEDLKLQAGSGSTGYVYIEPNAGGSNTWRFAADGGGTFTGGLMLWPTDDAVPDGSPSTGSMGLYISGTTVKLYVYNGSGWVSVALT